MPSGNLSGISGQQATRFMHQTPSCLHRVWIYEIVVSAWYQQSKLPPWSSYEQTSYKNIFDGSVRQNRPVAKSIAKYEMVYG